MLCPFCHKNDATIHYTEVVNGDMKKIDICQECAEKKGINITLPFSFSDVLTALSDDISGDDDTTVNERDFTGRPACSHCGLTLRDLVQQGRLGCPHCYSVFKNEISRILENVQKAPTHTGKIPVKMVASVTSARRLTELEKELERALADERYEDCIRLRDEMKHLKNAEDTSGETHA